MVHPKHRIFKNTKYLNWIREQECLTCTAPPRSQAHHCWNTGKKNYGNDTLAVPLCGICHTAGPRAYHNLGHDKFQEAWNIDLTHEIMNLLASYMHRPNE